VFHSSINPLPQPVRGQLKTGGFWQRGCPVPLSGLRLLTVSHRRFDGRVRTGQLVVSKNAARPSASVFREVYRLRFPLRDMRLAGMYGSSRSCGTGAEEKSHRDRSCEAAMSASIRPRPWYGATNTSEGQGILKPGTKLVRVPH
jgi:hypothetical protein